MVPTFKSGFNELNSSNICSQTNNVFSRQNLFPCFPWLQKGTVKPAHVIDTQKLKHALPFKAIILVCSNQRNY